MEKNIKTLRRIVESLTKMSEEKYHQIREYKFIWFAKDGEYGGCSHYKLKLEGTPLERAEPLIYLAPMVSKKAMISGVKEMIVRLGEVPDLADKKRVLSTEVIEDHLFGPHADVYNRFFKFFEIEDFIPPEHYGPILRRVYSDSLKKYHYRNDLRRAFQKVLLQSVMTEEEEDFLSNLDEQVTIYRVMSKKENELEDYGVSWTLYEDIALQVGKHCFESIWDQAGFLVKKMEVAKTDLRAYFNERNMREVVYVQQEIPDQTLKITFLKKSEQKK